MSKGTPTSTKKFFNMWQKTAEERKLLPEGKERKPSYGNNGITTSAFRKTQPQGPVAQSNGRNHTGPVIRPSNTPRAPSTISSQRLSSIPDDSTIANSSSDDVFDEGSVKGPYTEQYTNPVYDWVNETSMAGQPVVSIRSDHHPVTAAAPALSMADSPRIEFNKLPFACYTGRSAGVKWWSALLQGSSVVVGIALLPFVIITIIFFIVKTRFRPKMTRVEKRKETIGFCFLLLVALVKDFIVAAMIVNKSTDVPYLTLFRTVIPLLWFWWPVLFCCVPATIFYYADFRYDFGVNPVKRVMAQLASQFGVTKATPLVNTVDIQGIYLNKNYPMIAAVSGSNDELNYVKSVTSKYLTIAVTIVSGIAGGLRLVPMLLEMSHLSDLCHQRVINGTLAMGDSGIPLASGNCLRFYVPLTFIMSLNLLFVTLFFFAWLLYVLSWNIATYNEWKNFNDNENDDDKTLMNKGPQTTASWWKIRQTLILFSDPSFSITSMIASLLYYTCAAVSVVMSTALIMLTTKKTLQRTLLRSTIVSIILDNVIVYLVMMAVYVSSVLISRQRQQSHEMLERKKANTGYEISCIMNLEQELMEKDSTMRNRVRLLRGRMVLLQEMVTAVVCVDGRDRHGTCCGKVVWCFCVGALLVVSALCGVSFSLQH